MCQVGRIPGAAFRIDVRLRIEFDHADQPAFNLVDVQRGVL